MPISLSENNQLSYMTEHWLDIYKVLICVFCYETISCKKQFYGKLF